MCRCRLLSKSSASGTRTGPTGSLRVPELRPHRFSAGGCAATRRPAATLSRTDPAVIVVIVNTDEDGVERVLLGNNAAWEADRYSLLAGFVEPGKTCSNMR